MCDGISCWSSCACMSAASLAQDASPACVHPAEGFRTHDRRASVLRWTRRLTYTAPCACSWFHPNARLPAQAGSLQEGALSCAARLVEAAPHLLPHVHGVLSQQHGAGGLPFFVAGSFVHRAVLAWPSTQVLEQHASATCVQTHISDASQPADSFDLGWHGLSPPREPANAVISVATHAGP